MAEGREGEHYSRTQTVYGPTFQLHDRIWARDKTDTYVRVTISNKLVCSLMAHIHQRQRSKRLKTIIQDMRF